MEREIKTVLVVGAGFMGTGIAQSTAQAGYETLLWAPDRSELDQSRDKIEAGLAKMAQQGKLKDGPEVVGQRVVETLDLGDAAKADLVIETVVENLPIKTEVFKTLDRQAADRALLASNTSTIPITKLAALVRRPERVVGIHFSSPVPLMPVAEVIRTTATSEETFQRALAFVRSLGKEPIKVQRDRAGFVFNRVNLPSTVEAIKLVESGTATIEDVDKAMRLGFGRPMDPLKPRTWSAWIPAITPFCPCTKRPRTPSSCPRTFCAKRSGWAIWAEKPAGAGMNTTPTATSWEEPQHEQGGRHCRRRPKPLYEGQRSFHRRAVLHGLEGSRPRP